jgi:hypothetical protein
MEIVNLVFYLLEDFVEVDIGFAVDNDIVGFGS